MSMRHSKHRGLERLAKANARYIEQALKPAPDPSAYVQGYNADTGEYTVNQGGRELLKRSISNGAVKVKQQVEVRGALIDSTPRPLQRVTVAPVVSRQKLNGYILYCNQSWLSPLSYVDFTETLLINDLTGEFLGYEGSSGVATVEDFSLETFANYAPANVALIEAIFEKFLVEAYDYAADPGFPAQDEAMLRSIAQARGVGRFPFYNTEENSNFYQINMTDVSRFLYSWYALEFFDPTEENLVLRDDVATKYGILTLGLSDRFANMGIERLQNSTTVINAASTYDKRHWFFADPRPDISLGIEGDLKVVSVPTYDLEGTPIPEEISSWGEAALIHYFDLENCTRTYEVIAKNALDQPTIIWIRD